MADDAGSCASGSSIDSCPRECDISFCAVAGMGSFADNVNIGMLGFPGAITSGKSAICAEKVSQRKGVCERDMKRRRV